jgi:hypothetical protein
MDTSHAKRVRREVGIIVEGSPVGWYPAVRYDSLGLSKAIRYLPGVFGSPKVN